MLDETETGRGHLQRLVEHTEGNDGESVKDRGVGTR
jgi:hypothetical protein